MKRRDLVRAAVAAAVGQTIGRGVISPVGAANAKSRNRPGDPAWPSASEWEELKTRVGGRLIQPISPFGRCADAQDPDCREALAQLQNPYFLGDQPALTQSSGWVDAWMSRPSPYAVAAATAEDVVAAVNFARKHRLRLVVKGGGHSYHGNSNAADSLLIWTRAMNDVVMHDGFVARGCEGKQTPQPAVSLGAGALWRDAYSTVTTQGGRYVQGGGCQTVGVAGLIQGGGFGSWSKRYGIAAAGLLEAEIVTADGRLLTVNACTHPELFWALKGGGGGTFGVLTRLTLRTRDLPKFFGALNATIKPSSDAAYRALIERALSFYRSNLMNPHWGEKMVFSPRFEVSMVWQDLSLQEAQEAWAPFFEWVRARPEYVLEKEPTYFVIPAQSFWDPNYMMKHIPDVIRLDERPGAAPGHAYWSENRDEAGIFWHAYKTTWLPAALLEPSNLPTLVEAILEATQLWGVAMHFNKGLAGAPQEEVAAARETAMNPAVCNAFACAFIASGGPAAFEGLSPPNLGEARDRAHRIEAAMSAILQASPDTDTYWAECDYFQTNWQRAFWGDHYPRLAEVKRRYDPEGLFFVHHGVGSERWSDDGFTSSS